MEIKQIRYFLSLADTLNFTRAAEGCGVTQPTLTKAIRALEEDLGGSLLHREGKNTRLTELGRNLQAEFERIIEGERRARSMASAILDREQRAINFGIPTTLGPKLFTEFFKKAAAALDQVQFLLHDVQNETAMELILSGALDASIVFDCPVHPPTINATYLFSERLLLGVGRSHALADRKSVSLEDVQEDEYIDRLQCEFRSRVFAEVTHKTLEASSRFLIQREDWAQEFVVAGLGITSVPEYSCAVRDVDIKTYDDLKLQRDLYMVSITKPSQHGNVRQLCELANEFDWKKNIAAMGRVDTA